MSAAVDPLAGLGSRLLLQGIGSPARVKGFVTCRALGNMKDEAPRRAAFQSAKLVGCPEFYLRQVHGTGIVSVEGTVPPAAPPEADGWITAVPGPVLCVFVADCMPLFLWEKSGKAVGIFHVGWRGLAAGMPRKAVAAFGESYGVRPGDLTAYVGPHIGKCCYRVGPETAAQFRPESLIRRDDAVSLDLGKEAAHQLRESGLGQIVLAGDCTACETDRFFSYRREKAGGRMLAFITLDPE